MKFPAGLFLVRLLPVLLLGVAATLYVFHVEGDDGYPWRNALPILGVILLSALTLRHGQGRWTGAGWTWLLGTVGYAVPALGLSLYLHYAWANDLGGIYSGAVYPEELFRFLPAYTGVAGGIGFAIGWIVGRNV